MRYPRAAIAIAVLAAAVAISTNAAGDYDTDEGVAAAIDFVVAFAVTFAFWYGVVLIVGWGVKRLRQ